MLVALAGVMTLGGVIHLLAAELPGANYGAGCRKPIASS
jgi:hypothetical protein